MAESGIDLTFDDQTCGSTGQIYDTAASSMMSHLQSSAATSGRLSLSASAQMRSRKTPLRSLQRQALAKQQSEQQQQQLRHRYTLDTQPTTTSHGLSTVTALPTYHKLPVSVLREAHADINDESFSDVSGQTAPAAFSLLSLHNASQLWSNSAPELVTIEQLNPTSSNPTSFCEYDEQLNDISEIVSSIDNICGTSQSSASYLSASSLPDGSYRGGRRKEPPPPNMTTEQQLMWEQERDKKDKHNDIEKRRRYKINDCIQELGLLLPDSYNTIYREQVNSKGAILEATVEYIHSLRKDQQKVNELQSRVEQLEAQQRKLLLQRETLRAALVASQSTTKSPAAPAAAAVSDINISPMTDPSASSSPHVINADCYMIANDNDTNAILDLDSFVLDDVMMTDEHEEI